MMEAFPISREVAKAFIRANHSHNGPPVGDKFRVGARVNGELVAVAVGGRPSSRHLDDGLTIEIVRCCTLRYKNAASFCEGRILSMAASNGFRLAISYTLENEVGASLKATGFRRTELGKGGSWSRAGRVREDKAPTTPKWRWEKVLTDYALPASAGVQA